MIRLILFILVLVIFCIVYLRLESIRNRVEDPRKQIRKQLHKMGYKEEWMVNVTYDFYKMFQGFTEPQLEELELWVREIRLKRLNQRKS